MASSGAIKAGRGEVEIGTDLTGLERGLGAAKNNLNDFGKNVASFGAMIAGAGITAKFMEGLGVFLETGSAVRKASRETGVSFEEMGALSAAMGGEVEGAVKAIIKMDTYLQAVADGSAEHIRTLARLGLSFTDLNQAGQHERFLMMADALDKVADAGERAALKRQLLGRGAGDINLSGGRAGVEAREARVRELGGVISEKDKKLTEDYLKSVKELNVVTKGIWLTVGAAAAPIMTEFNRISTTVLAGVRQWMADNREVLTTVFKIVDKLGLAATIIGGIGTGLIIVGQGAGFLAGFFAKAAAPVYYLSAAIWSAISAAFAFAVAYAIPIAIVAALALGIYLLYQNSTQFAAAINSLGSTLGYVGDGFASIGDTAKQTFGAIIEALTSGDISAAATVGFAGIALAWEQMKGGLGEVSVAGVGVFVSAWDTAIRWLVDAYLGMVRILGNAMVTVVSTMMRGWNDLVLFMQTAWENLQNRVNPTRSQATTDANIAAAQERHAAEVARMDAVADPNGPTMRAAEARMTNMRNTILGVLAPNAATVAGADVALAEEQAGNRQREAAARQVHNDALYQAGWQAMVDRTLREAYGDNKDKDPGFLSHAQGTIHGGFSASAVQGLLGAPTETDSQRQSRLLQAQIDRADALLLAMQQLIRVAGARFA